MIRAEISEIETNKTIQKIDEMKSCVFFGKDKQYWHTFSQTKNRREIIQINKITDEKRDITTNNAEIQTSISGYYEQLYVDKLENSRGNG